MKTIINNNKIYIEGETIRWEALDKYGWALNEADIREMTINDILGEDNNLKNLLLLVNVHGKESGFNRNLITYIDGVLRIGVGNSNGIKFKMDIDKIDKFVSNIILDNEWELPPLYDTRELL